MSGSKEASINLTEGPIGKQILLFTVPLLLGNVFQQFYNAADTVIVGTVPERYAYIDDLGGNLLGRVSDYSGAAAGGSGPQLSDNSSENGK